MQIVMQTPEFTDDTPIDCACDCCTGQLTAPLARFHRAGVRGTVVAAVGAAVLVGAAAGTSSAEPAPSHAGWDGSKYWYKDGTGWWRWTSHYDKYLAKSSQASRTAAANEGSPAAGPKPPSTGHNRNPTFRGRTGWDATDRVYWYKKNGAWWWTSHKDRYERNTKTSSGFGSPSTSSGSGSGTPTRYGTEAAIAFAQSHLGDPYAWGGNGPHAWDCSGLVQAAYRRAGIMLPRVADDQYHATTPISRDQLRRGDLVFWSSNGRSSGIHHVAVYLGGGEYLEAPRPGKNVRVSSFRRYNPNMYGRVR
ncbi:C40 family peptidase [Streptomyces virginiae]|uniref:C40 family peptidase n=1 Tax=Streptomyces virginiae TaxID=1961 RepID=UPI0033291FBB